MCHFAAHIASCTGTRVPAGAVPARVHAQHWCVPRVAQSHLRACLRIPCVSTGDAQAASLHKQGQPMRMHACCIVGISLHALVTVVSRTRGCFAFLPCCCGGNAAVTSQRRGRSRSLLYVVRGLLWGLAVRFLPPPSSPLTSLLSHLLHRGQSPASCCTHLSALHGSGADAASAFDGAGRAEPITCQAPSAFPPFCLSLLPKPCQMQSEFMETIPTPQHQSCKIQPDSLPVPCLLLPGLHVESLSPSAGETQPVSGHSCWGSESLPLGSK